MPWVFALNFAKFPHSPGFFRMPEMQIAKHRAKLGHPEKRRQATSLAIHRGVRSNKMRLHQKRNSSSPDEPRRP
jgi:hypothetical protein